jgi:hypothetical protein
MVKAGAVSQDNANDPSKVFSQEFDLWVRKIDVP